jgi:hypothetical protein
VKNEIDREHAAEFARLENRANALHAVGEAW